jgi:cobalt-zinc-cadmium efflux system outer membrane protein
MKKPVALSGLIFLSLWLPGALPAAEESGANTAPALSAAVTEALAKNPEIAMLRERVRSMQARANQAPYLEDPELVLQAMGVPLRGPGDLGKSDTNTIGIRQKFPFFGKLSLKEQIALQEVRMVAEQLRAKEREIVSKVKANYADLFMAEKAVEILREQLEIARLMIQATEARYRVGKVTQQDVFKALLEQTNLMTQAVVAEEETKIASARFNALLNRSQQTAVDVPAELRLPDPSLNVADLERLGLANRPELKEAERGIEKAERSYDLADKNRKFPDFMLGWDYARMPTDMTKNRYQAMINITIPFAPWTVGRRNEEVQEALAEIRAAKASRDAARAMTLSEISEAAARVRAAQKSVELYREGLLTQAELSFRAAMSAYQTGRMEFVGLLEAQRALREARMGHYRAQVGLMQSVADLERAAGKELP